MTGRAMIETVLDYFAHYNRDMDQSVEERDIWVVLCGVVNEFAKNDYIANMKMGDKNVSNQYVVTFGGEGTSPIKMFYDKSRSLNYSMLPARPISLPNRGGYKLVCPIRNMGNRVLLCDVNEMASLGASASTNAEGAILGWQEQDRFYYNINFDSTDAPNMMFQMVVSGYNSISMDAELALDPASETAIRKAVIDYFMPNEEVKQDFTKDARDE